MDKFAVDLDKIFHWDLLGNVKDLGYDIKKDASLWYRDDEGALESICDDQAMLGLSEQLRAHWTVDIFVEISDVRHESRLPKALQSNSDSDSFNDYSG